MSELDAMLERLGACQDAKEWARQYPTLEAAWEKCERGDWMLWLTARADLASRQEVVLAACAVWREIAQPHSKDLRALKAIEVAEAWADGKATIRQVRAAAYAAYAASYAAADAASYGVGKQKALVKAADIVRAKVKISPQLLRERAL